MASMSGTLEPVSNDEDWILAVETFDVDTGEPFDLDDYDIEISLKDRNGGSVLSGSTDGGEIVKSDSGGVTNTFTATFRATTMGGLDQGTYNVGIRITDGTETRQLLIGTLQVLEGWF